MRNIILILLTITFFVSSVLADTYVRGYYRSNGTYVEPHYRSSPNSTTSDNWSNYGNVNPHTGETGTRRSCGVGTSLLSC